MSFMIGIGRSSCLIPNSNLSVSYFRSLLTFSLSFILLFLLFPYTIFLRFSVLPSFIPPIFHFSSFLQFSSFPSLLPSSHCFILPPLFLFLFSFLPSFGSSMHELMNEPDLSDDWML